MFGFTSENQRLCWACKVNPCEMDIHVQHKLNMAVKQLVNTEEIKQVCPKKLCRSCALLSIESAHFSSFIKHAYDNLGDNMEILYTGSPDSSEMNTENNSEVGKIIRTDDGRIKCNFCDSTFTQISSFKQHVMSHSGLKPFVCEYCNKGFGRRTVLNNHMRLHTGQKPYQCHMCVLAFTTKDRMDTHVKRDHVENKKSSRTYSCRICKQKFDTYYDKTLHQQMKDSPCFEKIKSKYVNDNPDGLKTAASVSSFICLTCHKKFSTSKELLNHQKGHDAPTVECKDCKILFTSVTELLYHETKAHNRVGNASIEVINNQILSVHEMTQPAGENNSELQCCKRQKLDNTDEINPAAMFLANCRTRARKEKGSDEHKCLICKAVFTAGPSLKIHLRSHTNEKPFHCKYCFKQFSRNSVLKVHLKRHTKIKAHKCSQCDMAFDFKHTLETHIERSHKHTNVIELVLYCSHCPEVFSDDFQLQEHMSVEHESINVNYKCEVCENEFDDFMKYKNHVVTHNLQEHISAEHGTSNDSNDLQSAEYLSEENESSIESQSDIGTMSNVEEVIDENHLKDRNVKKSCKTCKSLRNKKTELHIHIKKKHVCTANKSFRCHFCNELFYDVILFDEHLANVHDDKTYENQCPECSKLFKNNFSYRRHIYKVHDAVRLICCERNCGKVFESLKAFDIHVVNHFL
ncbi:zinc finger protein 791-like isoform X2 [Teleopsis dalmanni]|nr:zinc finger protein 791-like isoform X2 [Teleopsis dalmanni]